MSRTPRDGEAIQQTVQTIWTADGSVQCPACADGMDEIEPYIWECHTPHCPITIVAFNERIHNYARPSGAKN